MKTHSRKKKNTGPECFPPFNKFKHSLCLCIVFVCVCVCVCVCSLWGVFQGHRAARTVFAIEMQGGARGGEAGERRPPTWLSRLPKGTPNEFRVVEVEERSGTTARHLFIKGKKYTHLCARKGECVSAEASEWTYRGKSLVSSVEG